MRGAADRSASCHGQAESIIYVVRLDDDDTQPYVHTWPGSRGMSIIGGRRCSGFDTHIHIYTHTVLGLPLTSHVCFDEAITQTIACVCHSGEDDSLPGENRFSRVRKQQHHNTEQVRRGHDGDVVRCSQYHSEESTTHDRFRYIASAGSITRDGLR